jgi:hypothetical protein
VNQERILIRHWGASHRQTMTAIRIQHGPATAVNAARRFIWEGAEFLVEEYDPAFAAEMLFSLADDIVGRKPVAIVEYAAMDAVEPEPAPATPPPSRPGGVWSWLIAASQLLGMAAVGFVASELMASHLQ